MQESRFKETQFIHCRARLFVMWSWEGPLLTAQEAVMQTTEVCREPDLSQGTFHKDTSRHCSTHRLWIQHSHKRAGRLKNLRVLCPPRLLKTRATIRKNTPADFRYERGRFGGWFHPVHIHRMMAGAFTARVEPLIRHFSNLNQLIETQDELQ